MLLSKNTPTKKDMARTPSKALPIDILNRAKTGFSVPIRQWLLDDGTFQLADRGLRHWASHVFMRNFEH